MDISVKKKLIAALQSRDEKYYLFPDVMLFLMGKKNLKNIYTV